MYEIGLNCFVQTTNLKPCPRRSVNIYCVWCGGGGVSSNRVQMRMFEVDGRAAQDARSELVGL